MSKERFIEILDQAHLDIMDAKQLMDEGRYFHVAGELEACSFLMGEVIRTVQVEYK